MSQPFFRRWFQRPQTSVLENPKAGAEHNASEAQFGLGVKYANGEGVAQDYAQAAVWYLKAAEQEHVLAQFNLGVMYAGGQGVSRNDHEAEVWFGKAARHGDAGAQHNLGMRRYLDSVWGPPLAKQEARIEAYTWLALAAAQGYRGSEAAGETLALAMARADVTEAIRRMAVFQPS